MSQPSTSGAYHTRLADLERDRDTIIAFWRHNLGDPTHRVAKYHWFYANNPFGTAMIQLLYRGDTLIGCCGVAPRRMAWNGQAIRAGLLADMAVDAAHRTLGPALMLHEALTTAAAGHFDLLYGFPNHKSLPVVARLGYTVLGEMTRYSRVLRYAPYLRRYLPSWLAAPAGAVLDAVRNPRDGASGAEPLSVTWVSASDPRIDALWQASAHGSGLLGIRDGALLRWRFDDAPQTGTRYLLLGASADGPLHAWFACRVAGTVLRVCDYWCAQGNGPVDRASIHALVHAGRRSGCTSISFEYAATSAARAAWTAAGFSPRDGQPVIGKWLLTDHPAINQAWHITEADEDE